MPAAFNEEEQKAIRNALLDAALRHALTNGMKNTTLEELTKEIGISKGAFYHFYPTKEFLFLDMLEKHFRNLTLHLMELASANRDLSAETLNEKLLRESLRCLTLPNLSRFFYEDVPLMLRKLTPEEKAEHHVTIDEFIAKLLHGANIRLRVEDPLAIATIKMLMRCAAQNHDREELQEEASCILAESLCKNLVKMPVSC